LIQNLVKGIQWTAWVSALLLALAIGIGLVTAAWMIRPILTLRSVAAALQREDLDDDHLRVRQLERDTRRRDEFGMLAQTFLSMIREVRSRHDLLESQLEQLRVGVDHNEAAKQVADIAGTEFFQSLKRKARTLRQISPTVDTKSKATVSNKT
jgi:nitrate/nitrite-specific signal transduction histidine kinase